jgi:hypothetical protein
MTAGDHPASVESNGTVLVKFFTAFADVLHPKLSEINAAGALDLSCYLTGDGLNTDTNENNIEDPRLCSKQTFESPGDFSRTLELTYVFNPESADDDEARITLKRGVKGFIGIRWAVDADQAPAIGDIWDIFPVTMGVQRKQTPGRNSVHKIMQKPYVTGELAEDVIVVTG